MTIHTNAYCLLALALPALRAGVAAAEPHECNDAWTMSQCGSDSDCPGGGDMLCVAGQCRYACMNEAAGPAPNRCSLGETCVAGEGASSTVYYCHATGFSMDLNLLDMCLTYFIDGVQPNLRPGDTCNLERQLNRMLDQTGDDRFNIFDVDGCARAYLYRPRCEGQDQDSCAPGQVFCSADADCGEGLFCDPDRHSCQRECGFLVSREANGPEALERKCHGNLKICNYSRGQCVPMDLSDLRCQIDRDCPSGAYCFLGKCEPSCSRSLDCPDSSWYCTEANRCEPAPQPADGQGFAFDPQAYVVRFAEKNIALSPVDDHYAIPLVIMNLDSKRQVFRNPAVLFGYRLEVSYGKKQAAKCQGDGSVLSDEDYADCVIDESEQFVTLLNPFGTVFADGDPFVGINLNEDAFAKLTPGIYQAKLTAIFNNGTSDSATLSLHKTTMSGTYMGRLSIYVGDAQRHLGNTTISLQVDVSTDGPMIAWHELLAQENIQEDLHDLTCGYEISGFLDGNATTVFNWPGARSRQENRIPVRGLYSPRLARMRLIAVVDVPAGLCVADSGECSSEPASGAWERLEATNIFGRPIRRLIQLIGPFDARLRQFHGMYRETVFGLAPYAITLDGGFQLHQIASEDPGIEIARQLIPDADCASGADCLDVGFPDEQEVLRQIEGDIEAFCDQASNPAAPFVDASAYAAYLSQITCADADCAHMSGRVLADMIGFEKNVATLVETLKNDDYTASDVLTIHDYLRDKMVMCDQDDSGGDALSCVSESDLRCGLALYRKAIVAKWGQAGSIETGNHALFCDPIDPGSQPGCQYSGVDEPGLVTLQEHGRFYHQLAQIQRFQAAGELSDAFFLMYRAHSDPLLRARALGEKDAKLHAAWRRYEQLRGDIFSTPATHVMFSWPMHRFLGRGQLWLEHIQAVLGDRRDLLLELIDLKRRIFAAAGERDFLFVQHLFQEEYLMQVFLIWLQRDWQGESFAYAGTGREMLEDAEATVARINETRNPLGFHASRVFFENNNLQLANWEKYRAILMGGSGESGLLPQVEQSVGEAINEMRAALNDQVSLKQTIQQASHQFEQTVDQLCGPALSPGSNACETRNPDDRDELEYTCEDASCSQVTATFNDAVERVGDVACRADQTRYEVMMNGQERPCVRGQMGALLQEKVQLELQRRQIFRNINTLMRQIDNQSKVINDTQADHAALVAYIDGKQDKLLEMQRALMAAE